MAKELHLVRHRGHIWQGWTGSRWWKESFGSTPYWLALIASVVAILTALATPFQQQAGPSVPLIALSIVAVFSLLATCIFYNRSWRNSRYAFAARGLHHSLHRLRNHLSTPDRTTPSRIKDALADALTGFSECFAIIVGAPCSHEEVLGVHAVLWR